MITPRLGHLGILDYHRGSEAIAEGIETTEAMISQIRRLIADQA